MHVDLVGPWLRAVEGHTHLLTVVDRTMRWASVIPLQSTTAQVVTDSFVANWVAHFGVPATITTDQATQFTVPTWQCMCRALGVKHVKTTAYQPQSNGMVECFHRQLKVVLHARCSGVDWLEHLLWLVLGLRAVPLGGVGPTCSAKRRGRCISSRGQVWALFNAAQRAAATSTCTAGCSS